MKGRTPWNKGLTRADDGRITAPWEGKKRPSPSIETQRKRRRSMATVFRSRPTNIEKELYSFLAVQKIKFDKQQPINGKFIVDAYVPSHKLVIEADGEYWHSREPNIKRDKSENAYLRKCGYNVIRLKEVEILDGSFRAKLKEVLNADI
ncbi:MAG: DUF559 domain-containing protein [Dehalococcoidales bacterium]|nr:DUF559 domain-containing protein [Dehalococcoidales bacterium]